MARANGRTLAIGGGRVEAGPLWRFALPAGAGGYADAQFDDYAAPRAGAGPRFVWQPGLRLTLRARFSHPAAALRGTGGFGFWNAPYGDPTTRRLSLLRAVWFFFASPPNDLPFAPEPEGHGWFAATLDAATPRALALVPLAPAVLALNQWSTLRRRVWPAIRLRLGIAAAPLTVDLREWHEYRLEWRSRRCGFFVDGAAVLETTTAPRGPLGFVCWLDNQYLVLTPRGRIRTGTLALEEEQWLEIDELAIQSLAAQGDLADRPTIP